MANTHDSEELTQQWSKLGDKKVDFENMNDGLLNFCLSHGYKGEDYGMKSSKEDLEWLKNVFDNIESDAKIMYNILERCDKFLTQTKKNEQTEFTEEQIIDQLEYLVELVESIDNANDFIKMNGQYELIRILTESTNENMLFNAWWILQAIVQNNPVGQKAIFESSAIMFLLKEQIEKYDVESKVLFKIVCFICAFVTESEEIQQFVSQELFVKKYKEILEKGEMKIKDRLEYTLNKFNKKPFEF